MNYAQNVLNSSEYDSILKFRSNGDDASRSLEERYYYAKKAFDLSRATKVDSIVLKTNRGLSTIYLFQDNYEDYNKINHQNLLLAKKLKDSLVLGIAHHNLGWYHHHSKTQNDSAYYYYSKAVEIYNHVGELSRQVGALTNLSVIQQIEKDYLGSEESAVRGINLLNQLPKDEPNLNSAWNLYNLLGVISLELDHYDKAIDYHEKASNIAAQMQDGYLLNLFSQNNIAFVYKEKGDTKKALSLYEEVFKEKEIYELDPTFYALILDNIAFAKYLNKDQNFPELERMFKRAYKISDSLNDPLTKLAVTIDLSKFYKGQKKADSSFVYAKETYKLAKETNSNDMLLESLLILSELKPGEEGKSYLKEHIKLSDSLLSHERGIRNKFARVQFETNQIELENQRIGRERFWLLLLSIVLLLTLFLLYIIITQRSKNRALVFKQDQQKANEEIYNLMLSQQDKVDEARAHEKKRISEELHDGVLGKLFGTRLSLDSLNFKDGKDAIHDRSHYINELKVIEQDIRKISHDLNMDFVSGSGFADIIDSLIKTQTQAYQLSYDYYYSDDIIWENVSNKTKIHIYRILQETMQNIYKHAEATQVKISFHLKNNVICLLITDDGKGFALNKSKKGIGLKNIHSRVEEVDGTVVFESITDKGSKTIINIPYSN